MRVSIPLALLLSSFALAGCRGELTRFDRSGDAAVVEDDGGAPPVVPDAATEADGGVPGIWPPGAEDGGPGPLPDAGPMRGALADDLRLAGVDLYQSVRVPLAEGGLAAEREGLPVIADRPALLHVQVEQLGGFVPREVSAVVEVEDLAAGAARFVDTRVPSVSGDPTEPGEGFQVLLPAEALAPGARFRVRLESPEGVTEAEDAIYPRDGSFAELGVELIPPIQVVLVPFRYDTDGSGRLPDTSDEQLARYRAELTSLFPFADVDLRVHEVVPWSHSTRWNGNVDWGDVNATLISMRDREGAADAEYWYGLMAPHESRRSYCASTTRSCVTGQSYVATLHGTRVGSGVGFGDLASVHTFAHELGHMHGRYHAPCGTSGTDSSYPYYGGLIGSWGWDPRDGSFHDPDDVADLLGYCSPSWISDYTYRAIYDRHVALRDTLALLPAAAIPEPHRFVTAEGGATRWSEPVDLRHLPGERVTGVLLDGRGLPLERVEVGALRPAHGAARVWVVPGAWPAEARTLVTGGARLRLPVR